MRARLSSTVLCALGALCTLCAPALAQSRIAQFRPGDREHVPSTLTPGLHAFGDLDGDGDLDLVRADTWASGPLELYLNDGNGRWTAAPAGRVPAVTSRTMALALGDMDGDGDLDVVLGNGKWSGEQTALYLNDGTGTFTDATAQMPADNDNTNAIALGDVDGDGDLDIALGTGGPRPWQNRLYRNDGSATFTDVTSSHLPVDVYETNELAMGDMDGDGDLDLLIGNGYWQSSSAGENKLWLNDGTGRFTAAGAGQVPTTGRATVALATADIEGDGDLDYAVLLLPSGIARQETKLYTNDGSGVFTEVATGTGLPTNVSSLTFADLDGDGAPDLLASSLSITSRLYVALNAGETVFRDATQTWVPQALTQVATDLDAADLDRDGDVDVFLGELLMNDGSRLVTAARGRMPLGTGDVAELAIVDVDGDLDDDVVAASFHSLELYQNDGYGFFTEVGGSAYPVSLNGMSALAVGDLDGDGDPDLITSQAFGTPRYVLFVNDGTGRFNLAAKRLPQLPREASTFALGDVDGDGDLDLALSTLLRDHLWLNTGAGAFVDASSQIPDDGSGSNALEFADVDGDLDLDLLVGNGTYRQGEQNRLYRNDGSGIFTDVTASTMPAFLLATTTLEVGDVDRDGDLDLVLGHTFSRPAQVAPTQLYLNDGAGTFTDATARLPADNAITFEMAMGDIDADGDLDLFVGNLASPSALYLNDGGGTFSDASSSRLPQYAELQTVTAARLHDIDRDLDVDLVLGARNGGTHVLLNFHRQLHAPVVAVPGRPYEIELFAQPGYATGGQAAVLFASLRALSPPLYLPPLGWFGLDPVSTVAVTAMPLPAPSGRAQLSFRMPNSPGLAGAAFFFQAVMLHSPQLASARNSNVLADVVVR